MALIGTIEILKKQVSDKNLIKALDFLLDANNKNVFSEVKPGQNKTVEIEGRKIYAIFQEYETKWPNDVKIEAHKKYIDIQYIESGNERMFLSSYNHIKEENTYNQEKDVLFPKVDFYWQIILKEGTAAIFYPEDLHGPCCSLDKPAYVKKIVIKVEV